MGSLRGRRAETVFVMDDGLVRESSDAEMCLTAWVEGE